MKATQRAMIKPHMVLREEFDDWAVMFDPDTGHTGGLNPVSVYVWKRLDGEHTVDDIVQSLRRDCGGVPEDAPVYVNQFIDDLIERGVAEIEATAA